MRQKISKRLILDCAHHLTCVPEGHKCSRNHGHTYRVDIVLSGAVGQSGMMVDFGDLKKAIHGRFDHRDLNEVFEALNLVDASGKVYETTAENFCHVIACIIEEELLQPINQHQEPSHKVFLDLVRVQEGEGGVAELVRER